MRELRDVTERFVLGLGRGMAEVLDTTGNRRRSPRRPNFRLSFRARASWGLMHDQWSAITKTTSIKMRSPNSRRSSLSVPGDGEWQAQVS
jgi:hypothetical protein